MPRALVVEHDPTIHLGNLEPVLRERGFDIDVVDARSADFESIDAASADLVIILGNDSGVYEEDKLPYITKEKKWLAQRLSAQTPTLGVCFGAQIMASALGSKVYAGPEVELGFKQVEPTAEGASSPVRFFANVPVMQWHGDTFELPTGATRLASSETYANQAYALGNWGLAVQFHPEMTPEMHTTWIDDGSRTLEKLGVAAESLEEENELFNQPMAEASAAMLHEFLDQVGL